MPSLFVCKKFSSTIYCIYASNIWHVSFTIITLLIPRVCKPGFWFFSTLCMLPLDWRLLVITVYQQLLSQRGVNAYVLFHSILLNVKKGKRMPEGWGRAGICTEEWSQLWFVFQYGSIHLFEKLPWMSLWSNV